MICTAEELQAALFPNVTDEDVEHTLFWLKKYPQMQMLIRDFEKYEGDMIQTDAEGETARKASQQDLHSDKTGNTVELIERRRMIYQEYRYIIMNMNRAWSCILDEEEKKAVKYRYLEGYPYKIALSFFHHSISERTFDRRIAGGLKSMSFNLKINGILSEEWRQYSKN